MQFHVQHCSLILQEVDVEQGFVVVNVPVCVRDFKGIQDIWICKDQVCAGCHNLLGSLMPLCVYDTNTSMIAANLCGCQEINIFWQPRIREPVICCH